MPDEATSLSRLRWVSYDLCFPEGWKRLTLLDCGSKHALAHHLYHLNRFTARKVLAKTGRYGWGFCIEAACHMKIHEILGKKGYFGTPWLPFSTCGKRSFAAVCVVYMHLFTKIIGILAPKFPSLRNRSNIIALSIRERHLFTRNFQTWTKILKKCSIRCLNQDCQVSDSIATAIIEDVKRHHLNFTSLTKEKALSNTTLSLLQRYQPIQTIKHWATSFHKDTSVDQTISFSGSLKSPLIL